MPVNPILDATDTKTSLKWFKGKKGVQLVHVTEKHKGRFWITGRA